MIPLFISLWHGGLLVPILVGFGVSLYCFIRYSHNKSLIALGVGLLTGALSIAGFIALLLDK